MEVFRFYLFCQKMHCVNRRLLAGVAASAAAYATFPINASLECSPSTTTTDDIQVKRAVVIFRHGDRSPIHKPDDHIQPSSTLEEEASFWSSKLPSRDQCLTWLQSHPISSPTQPRLDSGQRPWGQLTNVGAEQARQLGLLLRKRLVDREGLLPITLNAADIRAHSTSIYRSQVSFFFCHSFVNFLISGILTLFDSELLFFSSFSFSLFFPPPLQQTLQNVLLGLYNMDERSKDVSDSRISINVTSKPEIDEFQYSPDRNKCSHLLKLHQVLTHHSLVMPMLTENEANVLNKMQSLFHYEKLATTRVRSTLVCLRSHGRSMPDGITAEDVVLLERANSMMEYKKYANSDYFKLALGRLVPRVLDSLKNRKKIKEGGETEEGGEEKEETNQPKLVLFSGHDSTIKPLTVALGLDQMYDWPKYCANILIEYGENKKTGEGHVRVLYNQQVKGVIGLKLDEKGWHSAKDFIQYFEKYGIGDKEHGMYCNELGLRL